MFLATPSALPDGKHFVFASGGDGIYIASLEDGSQEDAAAHPAGPVLLVAYTPAPNSRDGYLLFVRGVGVAEAGTTPAP